MIRSITMFLNRRLLYIVLLCASSMAGLSSTLPWCQCNCCPGEQCHPQTQNFSIRICDSKTCSFERCYKMYPNKCGLIPGITNYSCHQITHLSTDIRTLIDIESTGSGNFCSKLIILIVLILIFNLK